MVVVLGKSKALEFSSINQGAVRRAFAARRAALG
jgi:hypothetical protein